MAPTCLEIEKTKIKNPLLVFTFIFVSAHLILLYKKSLITNPQKSYCAPVMQSDIHADCQNIGIVADNSLGAMIFDFMRFVLCG